MTPNEVGHHIKESKRLLIMVREHIGDVVNSMAAMHAIRQNCPNAHITVSVGERAAGVLGTRRTLTC